ncbi:hypothetical protein N752_01125 [Desulforamulus aquiferis]|nr:hypothetical protein [Desulforamulus aquiferis]RYD07217.1 hypothetical protein N752_01125 [Desulforamulus aquiferis]
MYNNFVMLWADTKTASIFTFLLALGTLFYPWFFGIACLMLTAYILTLLLWTIYQRRKSKKWGLKIIYLIPCEYWLINWLAKRKGISIPQAQGTVWEMHLNTKKSYPGDCQKVREQFQKDLEQDLRIIKQLKENKQLGMLPVITLNTFNRYWLAKTKEILGGVTHEGVVLTDISCNMYRPQKHLRNIQKNVSQL